MIALFIDLDGVFIPFVAHAALSERLGLDGVDLAADTALYLDHANELFDDRAVAMLLGVLAQGQVTHIVVHSAWRNNEIDGSVPQGWLGGVLRKVGVPDHITIEVDFDGKGRRIDCGVPGSYSRCEVIRAYIRLHRGRLRGYAAIDDVDLSIGLPDERRFVHVAHGIARIHHGHELITALAIRGGV